MEDEKQATEAPKTFTQDEVLTLIQEEAQKVTETMQAKHQKELDKQKTLLNLDEVEREKAETEQKFTDLREEVNRYKLEGVKTNIAKALAEKELDIRLVDFITASEDTEQWNSKIKVLADIFKKYGDKVKEETANKIIKSNVPKGSAGSADVGVSVAEFKKMSIVNQQKLYETDKELYTELTKR